MFVTNRCLFEGAEPNGWIQCDKVPLDGGKCAFQVANTYASARADGSVILVPAIGPNETFTHEDGGNVASTVIGEGPRIIGVCA